MIAEYFDLYDGDGRPLDAAKPRELVHRDGDWHRSLALWIVRARGSLVVQRRSFLKDTHPGEYTASVSGHYATGEQLEDVLREAQEEIGVAAAIGDLVPAFSWRNDDRSAPGIVDRELMDVYLWPLERELATFTPDPDEVVGLAEIRAADFLELLNGVRPTIPGAWIAAGSHSAITISLALRDFVPMDAYYYQVVLAAREYLSGSKNGAAVNTVEGQRVNL